MDIKIIFDNGLQVDNSRAKIAERVTQLAAHYITLPDTLVIQFAALDKSLYGETSIHSSPIGKVRLNYNLTVAELIIPLVHELIHVNQLHTGRLSCSRAGKPAWDGKVYDIDYASMTGEEYMELPWEADVRNRQKELLVKILKLRN